MSTRSSRSRDGIARRRWRWPPASGFMQESRGRAVRLPRVEGQTVGIVAGSEADARAFEEAFRPLLAAWAGE